jgi:hypothetical protein
MAKCLAALLAAMLVASCYGANWVASSHLETAVWANDDSTVSILGVTFEEDVNALTFSEGKPTRAQRIFIDVRLPDGSPQSRIAISAFDGWPDGRTFYHMASADYYLVSRWVEGAYRIDKLSGRQELQAVKTFPGGNDACTTCDYDDDLFDFTCPLRAAVPSTDAAHIVLVEIEAGCKAKRKAAVTFYDAVSLTQNGQRQFVEMQNLGALHFGFVNDGSFVVSDDKVAFAVSETATTSVAQPACTAARTTSGPASGQGVVAGFNDDRSDIVFGMPDASKAFGCQARDAMNNGD